MSARIKSAVAAVAVAAVFAALAWNRIDVSPDFGPSRGLTDDRLARAMEGDAQARYDVALAYLGTGEAGSDRYQALHWFTLAADRGHARAQSALGHLWIAGGRVQLAAQEEGDTRASICKHAGQWGTSTWQPEGMGRVVFGEIRRKRTGGDFPLRRICRHPHPHGFD